MRKLAQQFSILLMLSLHGCCTRELAVSVSNAARESFFREQDRLQQRFLQIEADAVKDTIDTVRDVLKDQETREAVRDLAREVSTMADESVARTTKQIEESVSRLDTTLNSSIASINSQVSSGVVEINSKLSEGIKSFSETLQTEQTRLREATTKNLDELTESTSKTARVFVEDSRRLLEERELISQAARKNIQDGVQPLIDEIIKSSGQRAGDTMQQTIDGLSFPIAVGAGVLLILALVSMALPSFLLFLSYQRSITAIRALRDISASNTKSDPPKLDAPKESPL